MNPLFSVEMLQRMAVDASARFGQGKDLSVAVAEVAQENDLNEEQVKRLIEAANSVTYLQLLSKSQDRTFEFPVSSFEKVMDHLTFGIEGREPESHEVGEMVLQKMAYVVSEQSEVNPVLRYQAFKANEIEFEKLANEFTVLYKDFDDALAALNKDSQGLEKLASVADEEDYGILSAAVSKDESLVKSASESSFIFTKEQVKVAKQVVDLYKEAKINLTNQAKLKVEIEKVAEELATNMLKKPAKDPLVARVVQKAKVVTKVIPGKSVIDKIGNLAGASAYKPKPEHDVWANLQPKEI